MEFINNNFLQNGAKLKYLLKSPDQHIDVKFGYWMQELITLDCYEESKFQIRSGITTKKTRLKRNLGGKHLAQVLHLVHQCYILLEKPELLSLNSEYVRDFASL